MAHRRALITLSLVMLGGCASPQWTRPDFTLPRAARDERECQQQAERELSQRPPGFSVSQYYGQGFQPYGRASQIGPPGPMFDIDPVRRTLDADRIVDACMRAKGYSLLETE